MPLPGDLTTITVTSSYPNIAGQPQNGHVTFDPGQVIADSTGAVILTGLVTRQVFNGVMQPVVLPCTDNSGLNPTGFQYTVTETIGSNVHTYQVSLPHSLGDTVDLSGLTPAADPPDVDAFATANTWTSTQTFAGSPGLKVTDGAAAGDVLTSDADGNATWQVPTGGGGGGSVDSVTAGDVSIVVGGTASDPTIETGTLDVIAAHHPAAAAWSNNSKKITSVANGSAAQDAAAFGQIPTSASTIGGLLAADNLSDLANASTARTNLGLGTAATQATSAFDAAGAAATAQSAAEAASLALTGGTMSGAIAMGSHKVTGLTNGSGAQDAAAFGQIPTSASTIGGLLASSNLSDVGTRQTALNNLAGAVTNRDFLRGDGTNISVAAIQAADVPTLNQSTSGNAATATNLAGGATLPDYLAPAVATLTFVGSGTTLVNAALGNAFNLTLTASTTTLGNPSNSVDGEVIRFRITQGSGGSFTMSYGANYDFGAGSAPTLSTSAGKVDILGFEYVSSISKWCYLGSGLGF